MTESIVAAAFADALITEEIAIQDKMWGERSDNDKAQMQSAAMASIGLVVLKDKGMPAEVALEAARSDFYPATWSGFRDYGSDIANLVVAAAFLRSEIKRKLILGEDYTRAKRTPDQAYKLDTGLPLVSSEEAINGV